MILQNASHNGTAEASFPSDDPDFFEGLENLDITTSGHGDVHPSSLEFDIDDLWKKLCCPPETGESQHIQTNDPEQFPVNPDAAQQLSVSDLSQKDSSNKKERKRKRIEHNDERK